MKPCQPTFSAIFSIERWRYPMSGIASFMTSPSARTTKRSTPCVDGCCGPIESVMSSVTTPPSAAERCTSTSKPARLIVLNLEEAFPRRRNAMVFLRLDEVLAERMARPVLRHEDAAKVRVAREVHAEEVEHLALLPVGRAPDARHRHDDGIVARRVHLQNEGVSQRIREQVVDDLDVPLLRVVDAGEVREAVESERLVVATERAHLGDARRIDDREGVRAGAFEHTDRVPELLAQPRVDCRGVERHQARTPTGSAFRTSQRSFWIFSWSFTRPSVSASGRGGQPGT